jgi:hypothetical protein
MKVTKRSMLTGKVHALEINVTEEQLAQHRAGACIQDVCPHLSDDEREFLVSGSTAQEWKDTFGED